MRLTVEHGDHSKHEQDRDSLSPEADLCRVVGRPCGREEGVDWEEEESVHESAGGGDRRTRDVRGVRRRED